MSDGRVRLGWTWTLFALADHDGPPLQPAEAPQFTPRG